MDEFILTLEYIWNITQLINTKLNRNNNSNYDHIPNNNHNNIDYIN